MIPISAREALTRNATNRTCCQWNFPARPNQYQLLPHLFYLCILPSPAAVYLLAEWEDEKNNERLHVCSPAHAFWDDSIRSHWGEDCERREFWDEDKRSRWDWDWQYSFLVIDLKWPADVFSAKRILSHARFHGYYSSRHPKWIALQRVLDKSMRCNKFFFARVCAMVLCNTQCNYFK